LRPLSLTVNLILHAEALAFDDDRLCVMQEAAGMAEVKVLPLLKI
jgi:hypothetical protein